MRIITFLSLILISANFFSQSSQIDIDWFGEEQYNIGNSSLASHAQNVTTFSNTATRPDEMYGNNFCKQTPSMSTHGRVAGKNTRNSSIDCARNTPAMVSAFNQNPYTQSLNSWA